MSVQAVQNVAGVLKANGSVFVRDYAVGDLSQELLANDSTKKQIGDNFYVRGDGTCSYFFTEVGLSIMQHSCRPRI